MKRIKRFWKQNGKQIVLLGVLLIVMLLGEHYLLEGRTFDSFSPTAEMNGKSIKLKMQDSFSQNVLMEHDRLENIFLTVSTESESKDCGLSISVTDKNGQLLAEKKVSLAAGMKQQEECIPFGTDLGKVKETVLKFEIKNISDQPCTITLYTAGSNKVLVNKKKNCSLRLQYYDLDEKLAGRFIYVISAIFLVLLTIILTAAYHRKWKTERIFLILYLTIGLLYNMVIPVSGVPDEGAHMCRAFGITQGDFIASVNDKGKGGSMLPSNLVHNWKGPDMKLIDIVENSDVDLSDSMSFISYANTALYSPFTYVPQVIGIAAGRIFTRNIFMIAYIARFISWLITGIILYWSIRILPFGKNIAAMIALMPMNMHENISLAGDGFTTAIVIAFVCYVLYLRYKKGILRKREYFVMFLLLFLVASCKIVYMPICILAILVPVRKFPDRKNYFCTVAGAVVMVLTVTFGWLAISSRFLMEFQEGVNSAEQVKYILYHPLAYVAVIVRSVINSGDTWIREMFGNALGYLNIECKVMIIAICAVVLIYVSVKERIEWGIGEKFCRSIMFIACGIIFLLICTSLYVQWTAVASREIAGIQGRYFIPLLFPFILGLRKSSGQRRSESTEVSLSSVYLIYALGHILVIATLLISYLV